MQGEEFLNLEEMFGDSLGGSHFGSQDSFFGNFQHSDHLYQHREAHNQAHQKAHFAHSRAQARNSHFNSHVKINNGNGARCETVTQKVGNVVTTYTKCS